MIVHSYIKSLSTCVGNVLECCLISACVPCIPYLFDQTPRLLFFSLLILVWLLFEGGVYALGKPADINYYSIRHILEIQRRLLDVVCSLHSLSALLSSRGNKLYNTNSPNSSPVTVVRNYLQPCSCAVYARHGYCLRAAFISL